MASTIITKYGSGAPLAADLVAGELAVDLTNGRLYTEDSGGSVIEIGTNPTTLAVDTDTLVVDAANNRVGIGVSSPSEKLQINDGRLRFLESGQRQYNIGIASGTPDFQIYDATFSYAPFTLDGSGNVGIGESSPINLSDYVGLTLSDTTGGFIRFKNDAGTQAAQIAASASSLQIETIPATPIIFYTNSSEAMRIDANGNVGIGGVTPSAWRSSETVIQLQDAAFYSGSNYAAVGQNYYIPVAGGAVYEESNYASDYYQTGGQHVWRTAASGTAGNTISWSEAMRIDSSGNVGIGETSPSTYGKLVVTGSTPFAVLRSSDVTTAGFSMLVNSGSNGVGSIATDDGGHMTFDTGSTGAGQAERMRIDSSGNLLVGKTAVDTNTAGFEARSTGFIGVTRADVGAYFTRLTTDGEIIQFRKDSTTVGSIGVDSGDNLYIGGSVADHGGLYFGTRVAAPINAGTLTDAVMDLGTSGYRFKDLYLSGVVKVGSYATELLDGGLKFKFNGGAFIDQNTVGQSLSFRVSSASSIDTTTMTLDSSGNLLVGKSSSSTSGAGTVIEDTSIGHARINLTSENTTATVVSFYYDNGTTATQVGTIVTSTTTTDYNTSSDVRLKENIVDAPSASDDIDAIQIRSFDWKVDGSHQKYGMVAQELITVAPEAVYQPQNPEEMMGVDYSKLVPMMLKEIQQLRARVAQLEGAN